MRAVDLGGDSVRTVAGTGEAGTAGDAGLGTQAQLYNPMGLCRSNENKLLITEAGARRIRSLDLKTGLIST